MVRTSWTVPPDDLERVRAVLAGTRAAVEPRPAATVALVRDGDAGLEVYLMRRVRQMAFAAGMHVFPGGSVDRQDADLPAWAGPPPSWWARRFSTDEVEAGALVAAAVRELFEETGVLLAGAPEPPHALDGDPLAWEDGRAAVDAGRTGFGELLTRHGLALRADLLAPVAHWITPVAEPRRYDTRFFVAALPAGQEARAVGGEADARLWVRPQEAFDSGLAIMPPTAAVLADLAQHGSVAAAMAAERAITTVNPVFRLVGDELQVDRG